MPVASKPRSIADSKFRRIKTISVDISNNDEPDIIEITYAPDVWTRKFAAEVDTPDEDGNKPDNFDRTFELVRRLVTGWSWSDPLTPEAIDDLGFFIQDKILAAVMKDINGGDATDPKGNPDDSNGG